MAKWVCYNYPFGVHKAGAVADKVQISSVLLSDSASSPLPNMPERQDTVASFVSTADGASTIGQILASGNWTVTSSNALSGRRRLHSRSSTLSWLQSGALVSASPRQTPSRSNTMYSQSSVNDDVDVQTPTAQYPGAFPQDDVRMPPWQELHSRLRLTTTLLEECAAVTEDASRVACSDTAMFNTRFKKALECARRERLGPSRNMTADEVCESAAERLQALSLQQPQFSAHDQLWAIEDLLDEVVAASKLLALNLLTVDILLRDLQDPDSGITAESLSVRESVITVILVENMKAQSTYDLLGCTPPSWITELLAMEQVPAQVGRRHFTSALQKNHDALEVMRGALALFEQALTILRETVVDSL